jgi:hypothetical protein
MMGASVKIESGDFFHVGKISPDNFRVSITVLGLFVPDGCHDDRFEFVMIGMAFASEGLRDEFDLNVISSKPFIDVFVHLP